MSEVKRLMEQIELECQAMQLAMHGYAVVASHEVIRRRYDAIGRYQTELEKHVGEEEANRLVYETYEKVLG
jgi:hypothetical protein